MRVKNGIKGLMSVAVCAWLTSWTGVSALDATVCPIPSPQGYTPLYWPYREPATQYALPDGTLVTSIGGRVRDRHARELRDAPGSDLYGLFAPHYFERRTHDIKIYDNVSPSNPANRVLTLVIRPQWWWYGTNFRQGFIGRRDGDPLGPTAVALYGDNGGVKRYPAGQLLSGQELKTPIANYNQLPSDPNVNYAVDLAIAPKDGDFVLVKQITYSPALRRDLRAGDLVEFELGIFLAGPQGDALGRFNYYAEAVVYQVGTPGAQPWFRGPCCDSALIPWVSKLMPPAALAGGKMMTLQEDTSGQPEMSFLQAGTNIAGRNIQPFVQGRRLFHTSFLDGTHSEAGNPTLFTTQAGKGGPKFQQAACIQCHTSNGKSSPALNQPLSNMLVLTGAVDPAGNILPDSRFGTRLSQGSITNNGRIFDGRQAVLKITSYKETTGQFADGTAYSLQIPQYALSDVNGAALSMPTHFSVRTAPHVVGMGLIEAVPESALAALASASLIDPDGAVGRLQIVSDLKNPTVGRVGRFGWRASAASVEHQVADALNGDMGVTTSILPKHFCGLGSTGASCRTADATGIELSDADVDLLVRYTSLLGVPSSRHFKGQQPTDVPAPVILAQSPAVTAAQIAAENTLQDRVAAGAALFAQARCTACHVPELTTGDAHRFAELRNQTIRPYSDLLLHDMGPELADSYPQGIATQQEWRTAPLWGLGLLESINANTRYLHDGRARTIEEAILWHGGQGGSSRERFKAMAADDRRKLIDFVKSL
jgi:CxxC motif-containing protein (DUF1111 family)